MPFLIRIDLATGDALGTHLVDELYVENPNDESAAFCLNVALSEFLEDHEAAVQAGCALVASVRLA